MLTWSKALKEKAKAEGKALWSIHYKGKKGSAEANGAMDDDKAWSIVHFVIEVYKGTDPAEAFTKAGFGSIGKPEPTGGPA